MDIFSFIARSLVLGIWVSFRLFPVVLIVGVGMAALMFAALNNVIVVYMLSFLFWAFGTPFIYLNGIRAGLMSLRATTPPTANGMVASTIRLLFIHFLVQLILSILLYALVTGVFHYIVMPAILPEWQAVLADLASVLTLPAAQESPELLLQSFSGFENFDVLLQAGVAYYVCLILVSAVCVGLFGVPMAGAAANAVHKSPGHDPVYGFGSDFAKLACLYFLVTAVPSVVTNYGSLSLVSIIENFALGTTPPWMIFAVLAGYFALLFYLFCVPFAGMALAYQKVRETQIAVREVEFSPALDPEVVQDSARSLRQQRQGAGKGTTVYIPDRQRRGREDDE